MFGVTSWYQKPKCLWCLKGFEGSLTLFTIKQIQYLLHYDWIPPNCFKHACEDFQLLIQTWYYPGRCGSGPNLVILPTEVFVSHCNTGAHAARLLALQCGVANPNNNLEALALKHKGNKAFESSDMVEAETFFSQVKWIIMNMLSSEITFIYPLLCFAMNHWFLINFRR